MTSVFNAVALNNPYPAEHLNDLAWNQMVVNYYSCNLSFKSSFLPKEQLFIRENSESYVLAIGYSRVRGVKIHG